VVVVVVGGWLEGGRLELVTVIMVKLSCVAIVTSVVVAVVVAVVVEVLL